MLESIVDPSKEIKEGFQTYRLTTTDEQVYTGLKVKEDAKEVVIRDANGRDIRVAKDDVDSLDAVEGVADAGQRRCRRSATSSSSTCWRSSRAGRSRSRCAGWWWRSAVDRAVPGGHGVDEAGGEVRRRSGRRSTPSRTASST